MKHFYKLFFVYIRLFNQNQSVNEHSSFKLQSGVSFICSCMSVKRLAHIGFRRKTRWKWTSSNDWPLEPSFIDLNRLYEGWILKIYWESVLQYRNSLNVWTLTARRSLLKQDASGICCRNSKLRWRSIIVQKKGWALINLPSHLWEFYMPPC